MGLDYKKGVDDAAKKMDSYATVNNIKKQQKKKKKKLKGDERKQKSPKEKIASYKEKAAKFEENAKSLFEDMIFLFKKSAQSAFSTSGSLGSTQFLNEALFFAVDRVKSQIINIILEEIISSLGCSEETNYNDIVNVPMYIRVKDIDLFSILKYSPDDENSKFLYEKADTQNGDVPYSMNRQLYHRLVSSQSFQQEYGSFFKGSSGANLFDIKYVTTGFDPFGNQIDGDLFEITLTSLPLNSTNVTDFLSEYFNTIEVFNLDDVISQAINIVLGSISIGLEQPDLELESIEKFLKVVKRIIGICDDPNKKIDVSGVAKLSDEDLITDDFFEVTGQELREVEERVDQIKRGIITFADCGNIEVPVNVQAINAGLSEIISEVKTADKITKLSNLVNDIASDPKWKFSLPIPTISISETLFNDLLLSLPTAVFKTLLSPKVLLGFFIMLRAITYSANQYVQNLVGSADEFLKNFRKLAISVCRKIVALFIKELFGYIKSNIKKLVENIILDIVKESKDKQFAMYTAIVGALLQIGSALVDFRQCKSVIDEILKLLQLASAQFGFGLPSFILQGAKFLGGVSKTRSLAKTIQNLQESGLPTDDNADGSPNLMNQMMDSILQASIDEQAQNGKTEIAFPPTPQFPKGFKLYGKSY